MGVTLVVMMLFGAGLLDFLTFPGGAARQPGRGLDDLGVLTDILEHLVERRLEARPVDDQDVALRHLDRAGRGEFERVGVGAEGHERLHRRGVAGHVAHDVGKEGLRDQHLERPAIGRGSLRRHGRSAAGRHPERHQEKGERRETG